jgi:cytosine/adenosine deaminase-related metal-dependent hydrolase
METLKQGARAYFDAMQKKGRVQLVLIEGPAALGQGAIQQINEQSAGETLSKGITAAVDSCEIRELSNCGTFNTCLMQPLTARHWKSPLVLLAPTSKLQMDALLEGLTTAPSHTRLKVIAARDKCRPACTNTSSSALRNRDRASLAQSSSARRISSAA